MQPDPRWIQRVHENDGPTLEDPEALQHLYELCVHLYSVKGFGQTTICKIADLLNIPYGFCEPCDNRYPHLPDGTCLVCGSSQTEESDDGK